MDGEVKEKLWIRYTAVWRNALSHVFEWPEARVEQYIEELRREMESEEKDPASFGFFYDLPSRYLIQIILGNGLHERVMRCKSNEINPHLIYKRLVEAMAGNHIERGMEDPNFDWVQARKRYLAERKKVEAHLVELNV